ncbi:MAG: IS1595 family transposase, partial [Akkermansiaceae bacterium]|nr:IS1595 family transposase [Luteolibacter sp.]MCE2961083.1 IS1595 family transposase [Luteolibacter sp.]MCE2961311.1 IS1595 family transposase [Luteolibacter sp.]
GIKKENFHWFLKECEWRFNGGNHQMLLKQLKYWVKQSQQ